MTGFRVFATAHGVAAIAWRGDAIASFRLPADDGTAAANAVRRHLPDAVEAAPPAAVAVTIEAVQRYFAGDPVEFDDVAVDVGAREDFTRRVYVHIRTLRRGETTTYGAVAAALGAGPEAARAVGRAMATNPVPLIVPCHRVLAAGGRIGGFTAPGGATAKARMLALEGVAAGTAQQAFDFCAGETGND